MLVSLSFTKGNKNKDSRQVIGAKNEFVFQLINFISFTLTSSLIDEFLLSFFWKLIVYANIV